VVPSFTGRLLTVFFPRELAANLPFFLGPGGSPASPFGKEGEHDPLRPGRALVAISRPLPPLL